MIEQLSSSLLSGQYYRHAFGSLPAFIFCWVCTLVLKPSQLAIICLAFAKYTVEAFVSECEPPIYIIQLLCAAVIGDYQYLQFFVVGHARRSRTLFSCPFGLTRCQCMARNSRYRRTETIERRTQSRLCVSVSA